MWFSNPFGIGILSFLGVKRLVFNFFFIVFLAIFFSVPPKINRFGIGGYKHVGVPLKLSNEHLLEKKIVKKDCEFTYC